jgi:hypothetical protein
MGKGKYIGADNLPEKLIEQVKLICDRLSGAGWYQLFQQHELNIKSESLQKELTKPLNVDRSQPGFEDFSANGKCGIEPFRPAESLLFHAFASPQVISYKDSSGVEQPLTDFPTPEEICIIENYVYGITPPSITELRVRAGNFPMAVVVFTSEYRPAISTVHQKHADKCFSRVGICRVGTAEAKYDSQARGYLPFVEGDNYSTRVTPCYYSAYIAVLVKGDATNFGPMRFQQTTETQTTVNGEMKTVMVKGDVDRNFWVPIHKLFKGSECIRNMNINPKISATHINEKLRKVHKALAADGFDTGFHEPDISNPPFRFEDGIAELNLFNAGASGLVVPVVHSSVVEQARYNGQILAYNVPANKKPFRSSVNIVAKKSGARSAPEYVHARHKLTGTGIQDLNTLPDVAQIVKQGGYKAVHYVDYTGDGCVTVECPELAFHLPESIPAYSMVSAVDYFPLVKQYDLINWWQQAVSEEIQRNIWPENPGPPLSLCDIRYPANLNITWKKLNVQNDLKTIFKPTDDTISTIVGLFKSCEGALTTINEQKNFRVSCMPDGAAGVFAPGWDTSIDRTEESDPTDNGVLILPGTTYFNNYGLGSPFPEDAMLCAALSSFWPAAAPDITRTFAPNGMYATATPLTDDVIGKDGNSPWNDIPAPETSPTNNTLAEFYRIEYGDFVQTALVNRFDFSKITKITAPEYGARTLTMARVYVSLGALTTKDKAQWVVFSFTKSLTTDPERQQAENNSGVTLNNDYSYRFVMFRHAETDTPHTDIRKKYVRMEETTILHADPQTVIKLETDGWKAYRY